MLRVVGDGFLRGMVRALVGTLLEIGDGRRAGRRPRRVFSPARPARRAGPTAPAQALVLERVWYPQRWGGPPWVDAAGGERGRRRGRRSPVVS